MTRKLYIIIPLLVAISTFMLFRGWPLLGRQWLFLLLSLMVIIFAVPGYFKNSKTFQAIFFYLLVMIFNMVAGDKMFGKPLTIFSDITSLVIPTGLTYYMFRKSDYKTMTTLIVSFFILLVYTAIASFMIDQMNPGIIRYIIEYTNKGGEIAPFMSLFRMGLSNYYLPHALPVLIPPLFLGIRNNTISKNVRFLLIITLMSILLLVFLSGATTALLLSLIVLVCMLIIRKGSTSRNLITISLIVAISIPFIVNQEFLLPFLYGVENVLGESDFTGKVVEFQDAVVYGEATGDAGVRQSLYEKSFVAFNENPLLGTNEQIGGHSALLDRLASFGIIGFIPLLLCFYYHLTSVLGMLEKKYHIYYYMGVFMCVLMLSLKNMFNWEMMVVSFTILPISLFVLRKDYSKKKH